MGVHERNENIWKLLKLFKKIGRICDIYGLYIILLCNKNLETFIIKGESFTGLASDCRFEGFSSCQSKQIISLSDIMKCNTDIVCLYVILVH